MPDRFVPTAELLRLVLSRIEEAIVLADSSGVIRFASDAVERILGYPAPELVGRDVSVIVPEGHRERHLQGIARFEGTVETINDAWRTLLRGWLPGSGLQLDARPFLEHYPVGSSYDPATGVFDCELCIPVSPL